MSAAASVRGLRNNNPFNIRIVKANKWQGKDVPSRDRELAKAAGVKNPRQEFETFADPIMGLRAGFALIIGHYDRKRANTIRKLVRIWAPEHGDRNGDLPGGEYTQNTEGYIQHVAKLAGFDADQVLNLHSYEHLKPVAVAMMQHELGHVPPYTDAQINAAMNKVGVVAPEKPLQQTRTIRGGQLAVGGLSIATGLQAAKEAGDAVQQLAPVWPVLSEVVRYAPYALAVIALAGIGYMVWARIDDRRQGLR